ncbi:MAG: class I SAM-dependent methyltransferase [Rhodobacteraceae bacterium]|nr:class I SAM-dependent methyltransferase [Paracoccaceae bacterium]
MTRPVPASPYAVPGFYEAALAGGRHRDIVGGRWDETGRLQLALLRAEGMEPRHRLLDIGCGALRLGVKAVPFLDPGNYWGTDASAALMRHGREVELGDRARLPAHQLVEDADFAFPCVPAEIDFAIAFGVFTHLPPGALERCLASVRGRFPGLTAFLFTVFAGEGPGPLRQPDGVVTHAARPPYHRPLAGVLAAASAAGFAVSAREARLPRGQVLIVARPDGGAGRAFESPSQGASTRLAPGPT